MPQLLGSKVVIVEEPPTVRGIPSAATAVIAAVGVAERGPIDVATLCTSFEEYQRLFGGYTADSDLTLGVQGFFENGGTQAWISRTVHHTVSGDPTSKTSAAATLTLDTANVAASAGTVLASNTGPYNLEPGDTLVVNRDALGNATATFNATAAARETTNSEASPYALADADVLTVKIDQGSVQSITFLASEFADITNATAEEVAAVINAKIVGAHANVTSGGTKVTIVSDKRGTASFVEITGGTANAAGKLNFSTAAVQGTGNVANVDAVTVAEVKTIVELAVSGVTVSSDGGAARITSNTTGGSSLVQVVASSTADDELGFDNAVHSGSAGGVVGTLTVAGRYDGDYANDVRVIVKAPTNGLTATHFNLEVEEDGRVIEVFPNLSMTTTAIDYCVTVVNHATRGSNLIALTDLGAGILPDTGTFGPLTGGDDGLVGLADTDFVGGVSANGRTGFRTFDVVQEVTLLVAPGRATSAVHNAMITYCEVTRGGTMFAVLDPPADQSKTDIVTYVKSTASLKGLSEFGAIYWPRIKITNPSDDVFGVQADNMIVVPPSGHVTGMMARLDATSPAGVFKAPAGIENGRLFGALDLEVDEVKEEATRDYVFPELINPISVEPGTSIFVDGARTLKEDGNWPTIGERRGVIFVERSLKAGLAFMRHRNINQRLYAEGSRTTKNFLLGLTAAEAFSSTVPKEAFFVDFGKGLNPPSVAQARQVVAKIGLATSKPAEFVILKVSPDTRALDEELAAA
jgi:hypothetical protein